MDTSLILIIVLTFAFAATQLERALFGERSSLLASLEYLLIGVLVGPLVLGLLDETRLDSLKPLLAVVTGFVGFLLGLPLNFRQIMGRPRGSFRFALVTGVITVTLIGGGAYVLFASGQIIDLADLDTLDTIVIAAATLGLGATITSGDAIAQGVLDARADGPLSRVLPASARTIRVFAILGFGIALASFRARSESTPDSLGVAAWIIIALFSGVAFGVIFHAFVGNERDQKKLFVATIGVVALSSGIAEALHLSPLFVNVVTGATIANLSKATPELLTADERLRQPVMVVLLLLAGASWTPIPAVFWLVPIAFVALRWIGLLIGARAGLALLDDVDSATPAVGSALLSQGALVAAVAVNYYGVAGPGLLADVVLTTLLLSAVVNELWSGPALKRVLENAGESGRRPKTVRIRRPGRLSRMVTGRQEQHDGAPATHVEPLDAGQGDATRVANGATRKPPAGSA